MATAASASATQTEHHGRGNATTTAVATTRWGPYSGAGDFAGNMAVILVVLLALLALALALQAGARHLLNRRRERQRQRQGAADPEKPPPAEELRPLPPAVVLVYSASGTRLAGAASECAICLAEFQDGDAVRAMPACGHGFHALCIERWLAPGGRRSSCPTCRAPAVAGGAAVTPAAAAGAGAGAAPAAAPS